MIRRIWAVFTKLGVFSKGVNASLKGFRLLSKGFGVDVRQVLS